MQYGEWLNIWLEDYVRPVEKQRTYESYHEVIRLRLMPNFGGCEINDLDVGEIQHYITGLLESGNLRTGKPLSANSIRLIFSVFRNSLRRAYNLGYVERYIGDKLELPKNAATEVICFTEEEQRRIEKEISEMLGRRADRHKLNGIVICLYTGLRIGELLALEWEDIDFENGLMTISKTCHDGKDEKGNYIKVIESPKTYSSRRVIPLPDGLHKKFHALRHTFATRAKEKSMDDKTLSEVLGHKSPVITLKLYVHSLMDHKRKMMNLVSGTGKDD